ncbi:MAG TPA: DUF4192 family protein, partial [Micromonosporaceae bacterium]|nr:DUF4192 family protein [Micromonosporaceae bacterium]
MTKPEALPAGPPLRLRGPADLLAAVPHLLGFRPDESLVVIGSQDRRLTFACRVELPEPGDPPAALGRYLAAVVSR